MKNAYGIDKTKHYFVPMHPVESIFGISFTTSSSEERLVECEIVEERYKVEDNYKVTLKSIEPGYGYEHFYQLDFKSLLASGVIIEKTKDSQHVEKITLREPLYGEAYIEHDVYVIKE